MIHKEIKVYIDDMITKSEKEETIVRIWESCLKGWESISWSWTL